MANEEIQTTDNLDFDKVLADIKGFTEGNEEANKKQEAENQHLINVLAKINSLDDGDLGNKDIVKIFQAFGKNFESNLKINLSQDQVIAMKNELEYLIGNTTFDDRELEFQMNDLYDLLGSFVVSNEKYKVEKTIKKESVEEKVEKKEVKKEDNKEGIIGKINKELGNDEGGAKKSKKKLETKKVNRINTDNLNRLNAGNCREYLSKYIIDKDFLGKNYILDIIKNPKKDSIKVLQLQLVPYYKGSIDGIMNTLTVTAIENYIKDNLCDKEDVDKSIRKKYGTIRCNKNGMVTNSLSEVNIVISKKTDDLGHIFFMDYPDFEYEKQGNIISATIDKYNYNYDLEKNSLLRNKGFDAWEAVTDDPLNEYFNALKNLL